MRRFNDQTNTQWHQHSLPRRRTPFWWKTTFDLSQMQRWSDGRKNTNCAYRQDAIHNYNFEIFCVNQIISELTYHYSFSKSLALKKNAKTEIAHIDSGQDAISESNSSFGIFMGINSYLFENCPTCILKWTILTCFLKCDFSFNILLGQCFQDFINYVSVTFTMKTWIWTC